MSGIGESTMEDVQSDGVGAHDESAGASKSRRAGVASRLNRWRQTRPFWGALLLIVGGWQVMRPMVGADLNMVLNLGLRGASPFLLGGGMMLCAILALITPSNRYFLGIVGMVISLASLPFANLGGWILGLVLGLLGSSLIFAWAPYSERELAEMAGRARQKAERKQRRRSKRAAA